MLKGLTTAFIFILSAAFSCKTAQPETTCIDPAKINPEVMCTMEYEPVCGCDGKTYGNSCVADRAGVTSYTSGACDSTK